MADRVYDQLGLVKIQIFGMDRIDLLVIVCRPVEIHRIQIRSSRIIRDLIETVLFMVGSIDLFHRLHDPEKLIERSSIRFLCF